MAILDDRKEASGAHGSESQTPPGTTQERHPVGVTPRETASRDKDLLAWIRLLQKAFWLTPPAKTKIEQLKGYYPTLAP